MEISDQLGPGPNKLKIGPTWTETINFQRYWTRTFQNLTGLGLRKISKPGAGPDQEREKFPNLEPDQDQQNFEKIRPV